MRVTRHILASILAFSLISAASAAPGDPIGSRNKPERLEQFRDYGFGLFIHWAQDVQLGVVESHSLVGADESYTRRYFEELPRTFNPKKFNAQDWAVLAKLAGVRYVVFTTKHHSGFCMWHTATTDFSIAHTPFKRDITRELFDAFRAEGIAAGAYFSPDDFWWLYKNGKTINRREADVIPINNPGLLAHDQAQVKELMTQYGPIEMVFFDGPHEKLRDLAWDHQPDTVVTRGAINTPEQVIPGLPLDEAWESCITMGTQWQYKPANETYKTGGQMIGLLIETRAKGGNLLLNIGPKPDGEIAIEQEDRLREIGLWMFINGECIYGVRPWIITNEGDIWYTRKKGTDTVYAIVKTKDRWPYGTWREFNLKSLRATAKTQITVLGQNDKVLEYQPTVIPKTTFTQNPDGLQIRAMHAQRLYNDRKWPNPVVLKITDVEPALVPPAVETSRATWVPGSQSAILEGELKQLGDAKELEVGFEYRDATGLDLTERMSGWIAAGTQSRKQSGKFSQELRGLKPGHTYDIRAVVKHPLLTLYGAELLLKVP